MAPKGRFAVGRGGRVRPRSRLSWDSGWWWSVTFRRWCAHSAGPTGSRTKSRRGWRHTSKTPEGSTVNWRWFPSSDPALSGMGSCMFAAGAAHKHRYAQQTPAAAHKPRLASAVSPCLLCHFDRREKSHSQALRRRAEISPCGRDDNEGRGALPTSPTPSGNDEGMTHMECAGSPALWLFLAGLFRIRAKAPQGRRTPYG